MNREIERRLLLLESKATPEEIVIRRHITRLNDGIPETVIITRRLPAPGLRGTP